jgi:hypothetical protein
MPASNSPKFLRAVSMLTAFSLVACSSPASVAPAVVPPASSSLTPTLATAVSPPAASVSTPVPTMAASQFSVVGTTPPESIRAVFDGVILATESTASTNVISLFEDWGRLHRMVSKEVPRTEFEAGTATLVSDGATTSIMASFAWAEPAQGINPPICHIAVREYTLDLVKTWDGSLSVTKQTESCDAPGLSATSDGRGVAVPGNKAWVDVKNREIHHVSSVGVLAVGPMLGLFENRCGTCWEGLNEFPVVNPVTGESFTVKDTIKDSGVITNTEPIDRYRSLGGEDRALGTWITGNWIDKDTVVQRSDDEIYVFDVRTGKYSHRFQLKDVRGVASGNPIVDPATGTIFVSFADFGTLEQRVEAYAQDGGRLWTQTRAAACAAGSGQLVVTINSQTADLDSRSGAQKSFNPSATCSGWVIGDYLFPLTTNGDIVRITP